MNELSPDVVAKLKGAGWRPDREELQMESEFRRIKEADWFPQAGQFVRKYGGLEIAHTLFTWSKPIEDHDLDQSQRKLSAVVRSRVVAVASSSYLGDGCTIWIDDAGRFYAVDSEGMIFVGANDIEALNVLVGRTDHPPPPAELAEAITNAYEWHESEEPNKTA